MSNEEDASQTGTVINFVHITRKKQPGFLGYIIRKEVLENLTLTGHIEGMRIGALNE